MERASGATGERELLCSEKGLLWVRDEKERVSGLWLMFPFPPPPPAMAGEGTNYKLWRQKECSSSSHWLLPTSLEQKFSEVLALGAKDKEVGDSWLH